MRASRFFRKEYIFEINFPWLSWVGLCVLCIRFIQPRKILLSFSFTYSVQLTMRSNLHSMELIQQTSVCTQMQTVCVSINLFLFDLNGVQRTNKLSKDVLIYTGIRPRWTEKKKANSRVQRKKSSAWQLLYTEFYLNIAQCTRSVSRIIFRNLKDFYNFRSFRLFLARVYSISSEV